MTTREARLDDASAIARIHVTAWQVAYRGIVPDAVLDALSIPDRTAVWAKRLDGGSATGPRHLVVERDGAVVGWASVGATRDADLAGAHELYALYLDPGHWRQGVGTELYARAEQAARAEAAQVNLWVLEKNLRARGFYERMGFAADGTRKSDEHGLVGLRYLKGL